MCIWFYAVICCDIENDITVEFLCIKCISVARSRRRKLPKRSPCWLQSMTSYTSSRNSLMRWTCRNRESRHTESVRTFMSCLRDWPGEKQKSRLDYNFLQFDFLKIVKGMFILMLSGVGLEICGYILNFMASASCAFIGQHNIFLTTKFGPK